jgi:hypothetical protein
LLYFYVIGFTFFRKHGFRDHRQRRGREKVDYGEGIAMTGFYFALKGDNGATWRIFAGGGAAHFVRGTLL